MEKLNVAIHLGHFYPGQYFISPSERTFLLPFPVVWPGLSCRQRGTAKPKCRCSTWQALHGVSWPDKSRERNTAIYLYSLWFCVLRPRLPDPGWIFRLKTKTDGWLSIDIKEPWGLMSDPYVLIECEHLMCGPPSSPNAILFFSKQNAVGLSLRQAYGWRQTILLLYDGL